ncbi:isochorismatase hydrolase [Gordonia bronchialis DSM 43247]|uniref:Isochorismatase hydrolase n=1 Tax=Gordonia bronchialis (strain ATCC 25592 / DSM 43247 / BCRC 13721 / JCM 3198 / KCTC 3076 / NBRC 16047 / NCTC 10667) TaxID=526226 RepID=D0L4S4_GORB4|nr:isochorismatase family protein [Gordonia bronchialis]ACY23299.1 isochorismatase hydrolase [Gordonia bronchialis DSM 43247]MCC3321465.1 isochorismatase family protein [Gordonia bronchialis]QGS23314.1 isochorismatase family protein [Gordonia bronchialis]UAK36323.1 isochorismatase family protein [Gordonia bronchialis]STQ66271.1 nicotinamidase/pyrazinamidase [Gordonia bronchialis]
MTTPRRALIVVDVQNEYFSGPLEIAYPPRDESLSNITRAIDAAEAAEMPILFAQHTYPAEAPVFAEGSTGWELHPEISARVTDRWHRVTKQFGTVFAGTDAAEWLAAQDVDTVTIVGFMTNNCDLATAAQAETLGLTAEVLSDATGAINLANSAGSVTAQQVHETLMVLFNSNFAAVAPTEEWIDAVKAGTALAKGNLVSSAVDGRAAADG